jgi:hypothetical protein
VSDGLTARWLLLLDEDPPAAPDDSRPDPLPGTSE